MVPVAYGPNHSRLVILPPIFFWSTSWSRLIIDALSCMVRVSLTGPRAAWPKVRPAGSGNCEAATRFFGTVQLSVIGTVVPSSMQPKPAETCLDFAAASAAFHAAADGDDDAEDELVELAVEEAVELAVEVAADDETASGEEAELDTAVGAVEPDATLRGPAVSARATVGATANAPSAIIEATTGTMRCFILVRFFGIS